MVRKISFILVAFIIILASSNPSFAGYKVISSQQELEQTAVQVRQMLISEFGIAVRLPMTVKLVTGQEMDNLYNGAYRGAEIGLYRRVPSGHEIYIMKDMNEDEVTGTLAHEMTHAWQAEACVPSQDIVVKEGFASWIEYKIYDKIGAYTYSNGIKAKADPVYGVGIKKMLEWEDKVGARALPVKIRSIVSISSEI